MHLEAGRVLAFVVFGLLGGGAGAEEAQETTDMKLEDVGFVMRPANTPAQIERLRLFPPRAFVSRNKDGRRCYVYADPGLCKCAFIGDELAMKNYRDIVSPPPPAPMAVGSGDSLLANGVIIEMDPALGSTIERGDILDVPFWLGGVCALCA